MALIAESKNFSAPTADGTQNESLTGAVWGSEAPKIHMAVGYHSNTSIAGTTTVKPNADGTGATQWAITGGPSTRYGAINNGTASPDDTDFINSTMPNGVSWGETTYFGFEDMPADFDAITAVQLKVRQKMIVQSYKDGAKYQLFQSDGTTALSDEIVLDADGTDISGTFRTDTLRFTRTGSTTQSTWNGVQIKVTHVGDDDYSTYDPDFWISEMQLEIDYDKPAAAAADVNTDISNSIGWATNDADCAIGFSSQNGVGTTVADRTHQNAYCIHPLLVGGGAYERAVQSSYAAAQVGHTWSSSATHGYNYFLMALGGSDITNVSIDTITGPTSTGDVSFTGVGFQPDFLFVVHQISPASLPVTSIHIANGFGMSDGTTDACIYSGSQDALTTSNTNSVLSSNFIHVYGLGDGGDGIWDDYEIATVKSLDVDGYTFTFGTVGGIARYYSIIAVKGPFAKVVHALQAASNTTSDVSSATSTTGTTTVKPNADGTDAVTNWALYLDGSLSAAAGAVGDRFSAINNGTASPDDDDFINSSMVQSEGSETTYFGFENMPADFVTATSVTVKVRQKIFVQSGYDGVKYQLFDSFGTTALSDEIVLDADGTDISSSYRTDTLSFTRTGSTTKSTWDGVQIKITHIGNDGDYGDHPDFWISEMQLEIAYVSSTPESGTGFVPNAGICIGAMKIDSQVATAHNRVTIGTWDAQDNMNSMGWMDEDNQSAATDADSYISPTHSINNYNHAQTIVGQATVAAEGNGIRETWTNTNGTQYAHAWLLLGGEAIATVEKSHLVHGSHHNPLNRGLAG